MDAPVTNLQPRPALRWCMYRISISIAAAAAALVFGAHTAVADETSRLAKAATVIQEIKNEVPQEYWDRARCIVVIPELKKAALVFGGEYGKGAMSCRSAGAWSAPLVMPR